MRGTTHMLVGATVALPFVLAAQGWERPVLLGVGAVAALMPDIDHPNSTLGRLIPWPSISDNRGPYEKKGRRGFTGPIWHRDQLHSLGFGALLTLLLFGILTWTKITPPPGLLPLVLVTFALGFISHLVMDAANVTPQMLLWPFSHERFAPPLPHIAQHSFGGVVLEMVCTIFCVLLIVHLLLPSL